MDMIEINDNMLAELHSQAAASERKRVNFDLRTTAEDGSQRMLNALMPGTQVPIHRHPQSNETVICLSGKLVEIIYEEDDITKDFPMGMDAQDVPSGRRFKESARYMLDPSVGNFGCVVPAGAWHTVEVLEPSVIFEAKDGAYGQDGSENFDPLRQLKHDITYLIGMERLSGSMEVCSPLYISRMLHQPLALIEQAMREMGI